MAGFYTTRLTSPDDFDRAFHLSQPLLKLKLMGLVLDKKCSEGIANDTMAALLQARDLIRALHRAGLTVHDLRDWIGEWEDDWKAVGPPETP